MDIKNVRKWCREFNEGRINVHDKQRSGRPSLPESSVARIDEMVRANRRITLEEIEDGLNEDCSHFSKNTLGDRSLRQTTRLKKRSTSGSKRRRGEWYNTGITKLVDRMKKVIEHQGDKKGRRPVRGQITKLINSVETALKKPVEELDKTDLRVSALQLEDLCRDLHEWDEKVTEAMLDEEVTEEEQDKEYDERLKYDRLIKRMREELEKVLNLKKGVSPQPDETSSETSNSTSRRRVLLPKRKLPEFGGDVREWITFWSRFEDIHNDEDLSDSDKYQYLVDCMLENSEAQQLVQSYPVSGKNYASVIKDLKERFGRDITC
ncbi:hypothetical protein LAZ67_15001659 [Cordylochernes scorpioides]|uniref:Transposase n=1 Tax=Cordylochernes scorpioides TaxID=51811 RepID=A0ABY6LDN9_9ARAC|nr:hypothetical protein LAZ67_15001659 [Cordylochernes scorpioides]